MATPQQIALINQRAAVYGLDPQAVDAIGGHEGFSGGIGDGGHAFGPFQMNNAGGVLTGQFQGQTPQQINQWAWSPAGINYALSHMSQVAKGLKGRAAVTAIASKYERPANLQAEINDAMAHYGQGTGASVSPAVTQNYQGVTQQGLGAQQQNGGRQALLSYLQGSLANYGSTGSASNPAGFTGLLQGLSAPQAQAAPQPQGRGGVAPTGSGGGAGIAKTALTQVGIPYQWGGKPGLGNHTDCSGLLQESAAANGVQIGRTTYQQWKQGTPVNPHNLQAGDAVFFNMTGAGPEHVGIYIGNGKFVEDPHTGSSVRTQNLSSYPGFVGARRYT